MKLQTIRTTVIAVFAVLGLGVTGPIQAQSQGVSAREIVLGTVQDLSGPMSAWGKPALNGLQLRFEEANAAGGVRGRRIRLVAEDHGLDPKRAVLAAQKLVGEDKVFAVINMFGSPQNIAVMPVLFEKNVMNFLAFSGHRQMFEPFHRLKFAVLPPNYDQMRIFVPRLAAQKGSKRPCIVYQDDEFGLEMMRGADAGLKTMSMQVVEKTSYKRGATDFTSQVARLAAAQCDLVVLGSSIREAVGILTESRKVGLTPVFLGAMTTYSHLVHVLGGEAAEGLYASTPGPHPYLDDENKLLAAWAGRYKARFGEDPNGTAWIAYVSADIFVRAAEKAGQNLTVDSFIGVMENTTFSFDAIGVPTRFRVTPSNRLGWNEARLYQIRNGRWRPASDYVEMLPE